MQDANDSNDLNNLNEPKVIVYVPKDAKLSIDNKNLDPPSPKYDNRRKIFNMDAIKKLVGGLYGRK